MKKDNMSLENPVDFTEGLKRFGNQPEIYTKTLKIYFREYSDIAKIVTKVLIEKNNKDAAKVIHGIKGSAGILGLVDLYEALQTLEDYLKGDLIESEVLADLTKDLSQKTEISKRLTLTYIHGERVEELAEVEAPLASTTVKSLLKELYGAIKIHSPRVSAEVISELIAKGLPETAVRHLDHLKGLLKDFLFHLALDELQPLLDMYEVKASSPIDHRLSGKPFILTIDDQTIMLQLMVTILSQEYEVLTATNGSSALQVLSLIHPRLILADRGLPDISGIQLCHIIRETSQVPIVIVSGTLNSEDDQDKSDSLYSGYLLKPFKVEDLLQTVKAYLN